MLDELSAAIIVDQQRIGGNARSTVGTYTDAYTMLRVLFCARRRAERRHEQPLLLQRPDAACARPARGSAGSRRSTRTRCVDDDKSLNEGAIDFPNFAVDSWYWKVFVDSGFFDPDKKIGDYTPEQREQLLYAPETQGQARPRLQADEHRPTRA